VAEETWLRCRTAEDVAEISELRAFVEAWEESVEPEHVEVQETQDDADAR
jgi:hypothetical protein